MITVRTILSLAAQQGWQVHQLDVKGAFLHGDLNEEVYMEQPPGFIKPGEEHMVCKLKKALYGLKQAPRMWYAKMDTFLQSIGFVRCMADFGLYIHKTSTGKITIFVLYVDDLLLTGDNNEWIEYTKQSLASKFEITDLGLLHYYLGVAVQQSTDGIFINQGKYALRILEEFGMSDCKPVDTPMLPGIKLDMDESGERVNETDYRRLIGNLIYLTTTRPDLTYSVGILSRFMHQPKESHWSAAKRILRYIKGTTHLGLQYSKGDKYKLIGFSDADWAGDIVDRKSTTGYCYSLGSAVISWSSKKQASVSLSSTEAEYKAAASTVCEGVWLTQLLKELGLNPDLPIPVFCDNQSAIKMTKNPIFHSRTKHIETHHHFIRDKVQDKEVEILYCPSSEQLADIFTKPLARDQFKYLRDKLGMITK